MKHLKFVLGILLVSFALALTILALFIPENGLLLALWDLGIFTLRGEASRLVVFLSSGLLFLVGLGLLCVYAKNTGRDA